MAPKTSTFFDLKTCLGKSYRHSITQFENWQATLIESGKRAYPGRNPETMIFHRVHSAFAEVSSLFDPLINDFILSDSNEQEYTRTVVFAVFSSKYEFSGACHWTRVTKVWDILDLCGGDKGWVVYHNNQRLEHHRVSVHHGDVFACYERQGKGCCCSRIGAYWSCWANCAWAFKFRSRRSQGDTAEALYRSPFQ